MLHFLEGKVSTYINYLEFFCMGELSILLHLLVYSIIYINTDSWMFTLYSDITQYCFIWLAIGSSFSWL